MQAKLSIRTINTLTPAQKPYEIVDTDLKGFLLRIQPSGVMTYYFVYRNPEGKKLRSKIGRHGAITFAQARDIALRMSAKVINGIDIQHEKKTTKTNARITEVNTLSGFLNLKYAGWLLSERKAGKETLKSIKSNFKEIMSHRLQDISPWLIEKWRMQKLNNGIKAATVNRNITDLKALLAKAVLWEIIQTHPLIKLKPLKTDSFSKVRYLTPDEEQRLRDTLKLRDKTLKMKRSNANQWRSERSYKLFPDLASYHFADQLHPMVLISINTGLRRGELFSLKWANINFDTATLTIEGTYAKSGKTRHIPLNIQALDSLKEWRKQTHSDTLVFSGRDGNKIDNVRKSWKNLLKTANINDFRWHDMRHHFASKLVMAGVDLNTVRELLGHSKLEMTLRYAHLAPEHKAEAVARLVSEDLVLCHK